VRALKREEDHRDGDGDGKLLLEPSVMTGMKAVGYKPETEPEHMANDGTESPPVLSERHSFGANPPRYGRWTLRPDAMAYIYNKADRRGLTETSKCVG